MKRGNAVLIILLLFCSIPLFAQQKKDSLRRPYSDSLKVYHYHIAAIDTDMVAGMKRYTADTLLTGFQKYDPALESSPFRAYLGNIGLAGRSLVFGNDPATSLDLGMHAFDAYRFTNENVNYYSSVAPFTELYYSTGSRKEQVFHVLHSHTIKKQLVIGAKYRIINALGIDQFRQKSDISNIMATAHFNTRNHRYGFIGNYIHNRFTLQENGGISNDSIYEAVRAGTADSSYTYYLKNAQTNIRETSAFLEQYLNLFSLDTSKAADTMSRRLRLNIGRFSHSIHYFKQTTAFIDAESNTGLFPGIDGDTTWANDSVRLISLENRIMWTNPELNLQHQARKLRLYAGITYRYSEVLQKSGTSYLNQYIPKAGFTLDIAHLLRLSASAEYIAGNYGAGNYIGRGALTLTPGNDVTDYGNIRLSGSYSKLQPGWCSTSFSSKYFTWYRSFNAMQWTEVSLEYAWKRLSVALDYYSIKNYVFFGRDALPVQKTSGSINVYVGRVQKNFIFGKFAVHNNVVLQFTPNDHTLRLPWLVAGQSWYFSQPLFKKALLAQLALDLKYNTPFYGDAWMPATQQFFLQDNTKTGNYLYADVALNFKIKRARLFVKLSHFNSGLMGYDYYSVPHYPMQDRSFVFGVSWLFYD